MANKTKISGWDAFSNKMEPFNAGEEWSLVMLKKRTNTKWRSMSTESIKDYWSPESTFVVTLKTLSGTVIKLPKLTSPGSMLITLSSSTSTSATCLPKYWALWKRSRKSRPRSWLAKQTSTKIQWKFWSTKLKTSTGRPWTLSFSRSTWTKALMSWFLLSCQSPCPKIKTTLLTMVFSKPKKAWKSR